MYAATPSATATMKKLTFQWSAPMYIITQVRDNTCSVKPLVSQAGRAGGRPKVTVMNLAKVKFHSTPPSGFWLGCRVLRKFGSDWYQGTVDDISVDEGQTYFHVTFEDFDEQELDMGEVWDSVIYHPELEGGDGDLGPAEYPEVGSTVLFAANQQPCLGKVVEVQPYAQRQVVVQLWTPARRSKDFISSKFRSAASDGEISQRALTVSQLRLSKISLSESGNLSPASRKDVAKMLKEWRRR